MIDSKKNFVSRDNFDQVWLESDSPGEYERFSHRPIRERKDSRDTVAPSVSSAIVDHHIHQRRVADWLVKLGYAKTASRLRAESPKSDTTRKGNFGEVIASEHLVQRYGYQMPVFKLRYRDSHNMPMRGEDIVAFVLNSKRKIKKICIGEAKTRKVFKSNVVLEAHDRLRTSYHPRPETLSMLANILYEKGDETLGAEVDRVCVNLAKSGIPIENWIFLITESKPQAPFAGIEALESIVESLVCVDLQLTDLEVFINGLFDNAAPPS